MRRNPYADGLNNIVGLYVKQYGRNPELIKRMLIKYPSVRMVLAEAYEVNRKQRLCEDIKNLPQEQKEQLWQEAKDWTGSKNKNVLHDTCKAIIVIGSKL